MLPERRNGRAIRSSKVRSRYNPASKVVAAVVRTQSSGTSVDVTSKRPDRNWVYRLPATPIRQIRKPAGAHVGSELADASRWTVQHRATRRDATTIGELITAACICTLHRRCTKEKRGTTQQHNQARQKASHKLTRPVWCPCARG